MREKKSGDGGTPKKAPAGVGIGVVLLEGRWGGVL